MTDRFPDQPAQPEPPERGAWQLPAPADPPQAEPAQADPTSPGATSPEPTPGYVPPGYATDSYSTGNLPTTAYPAGDYPPPSGPGYQAPGSYAPSPYPSSTGYSAYPTGGYGAPLEQTAYEQPQYGQPAYGQPQYGQPQYSQPQYGQPAYGQPQYGQPQNGQPAYGQPQYGQSQYGRPAYGQPDPTLAAPPEKRRNGRIVVIAAVTAAVVGGGLGAGLGALTAHNTDSSGLSFSNATAKQPPKIDGTVIAAVARIQPSVVTINVTGTQESGTGSGVIIRADGYILTNDHVVSVAANGGTMSVVTNDGQQASATLVGADVSDDLAVIKVVGLTGLTAATFGTSSKLVAGQTVVAVGAPLGLSDTVTSGIVSNIARPVVSGDNDDAVFDAVQTDAAINPGNSGGPLVDLNGNVIGINAAIATANSGGVQVPGQTTQSGSIGIGFAIPADEASRIAAELVASGKATHAVIGVSVSATATTTGATIASVTPNSAAAAAGMAAGDIVTRVGAQLIPDGTSLIAAIRSRAPGDTVAVTFSRKGVSKTVQVKLGTGSN
jgi:putative serine protease PepD